MCLFYKTKVINSAVRKHFIYLFVHFPIIYTVQLKIKEIITLSKQAINYNNHDNLKIQVKNLCKYSVILIDFILPGMFFGRKKKKEEI